jgi:NAD(P) transhydrogenase
LTSETTAYETNAACEVAVLGGGPAGIAAAERAVGLGAEVCLVRPPVRRGSGIVPGGILRSAFADAVGPGGRGGYGVPSGTLADLRFDELRDRADRVVQQDAASADEGLRSRGITIVDGLARFDTPHMLTISDGVTTRVLRARRVIIAVGAIPRRPADVGFDGRSIVATDDLLSLGELPALLTIVGAGAVGLEYASLFAALGARVTLVEQAPSIRSFADRSVLDALLAHLASLDVEVRASTHAVSAQRDAYGTTFTHLDGQPPIASRGVIWAAGMQAATSGLDLAAAGVEVDTHGRIAVDSRYRTSNAAIFAAGGVVNGWTVASESARSGRAAASAALDQEPDERGWPIAHALHTIPEIASVGPTRSDLERDGTPFVRGIATAQSVLAAQIHGEPKSVLELFASPSTRTLLAAHAFGTRSIETIHFAQLAISTEISIDALATFPFNHPTFSEAYHVAARDAISRLPASG